MSKKPLYSSDTTQQVVASGFGFDGDLDDDGVLDAFDFIILFDDFDNDEVQDHFE